MATEYSWAPQTTEDVIGTLISAHHPDLESMKYKIVFQDKPMKSRGKETIGKIVVLSGLTKHLSKGLDFVIVLSQETWHMQDEQTKAAFVDSLLCQLETLEDGDGVKLRPFDFFGMIDNVRRFGAWSFDLRRARTPLLEQLELPLGDGKKKTQAELIADMKAADEAAFADLETAQAADADAENADTETAAAAA